MLILFAPPTSDVRYSGGVCQFSSGKLIAFRVTARTRCNRIPEAAAAARRASINREIRAVAPGRAPIIERDNEDQR